MTVQRCQSKFNNSLEVSNDGSSVSSLGGMDLVAEFAHKIGLEKIIDQNVDYEEYRKAPRYSFTVLTIQFIFRLIAGYSSDVATNILRTDPTWRLMFKDGVSSLPLPQQLPAPITRTQWIASSEFRSGRSVFFP